MNALARKQQALLQALWQPKPDEALAVLQPHVVRDPLTMRGLRAYRSNGRELARRALAAAYPSVAELLGEENFAGLARQHWLRHPPEHGDIGQWGAALPAHIESIAALVADEPQLPDVARIDWALHRAAFAHDAQADVASLNLLVERDPGEVTLRLALGTACVAQAIVWRQGLAPRKRAAQRGEPEFITALQERRSLLDSLQAAPTFDFNPWLAPAVHDGLVLGAQPL